MPQVYAGSAAYPAEGPDPVVTIGNFDGVHHGHRALLARLVERARELGAPPVVYTFEPSPRVVLAPSQYLPRILTWPDKVRLLGEQGVEAVVVERFDRAFAQHPPDWFAREILGRRLRAQELVVGYDFRFGRARRGDVALLRRLLPDLPVVQVEAAMLDGRICSSSAVRDAVRRGDIDMATRLLGRPHFVRGTVVAGDQRGRTIGFPTANVDTDTELLPGAGVYAVYAHADDGRPLPAVANLGVQPTFSGSRQRLEVHVLDFQGDLYGRELRVDFMARLRDERRFSDVDALVRQIRQDVDDARACLVDRGSS
ncbi:MAG: bifunctional riboflavin kinase/FAD synthetase [Deltaproteobacteria bacterium]|nr:MAG: bifunctional riboflavin kinase/FAD synthetase [Deltaproteobacteria bacterium]